MATYIELYELQANSELINKCSVAIVIAAQNKLNGTPTEAEQKFASSVFDNPKIWGQKALRSALAENKNISKTQIESASDAALQSNVDSIIDDLIAAYNALLGV